MHSNNGQGKLNRLPFILEGTTTGGMEGDIAVDDVTLYDGQCETIHSRLGNMELDSSKFTPKSFYSPIINQHTYEWKCFAFWYYAPHVHVFQPGIQISMKSANWTKILKFIANPTTRKWLFAQLPLPKEQSFKIVITGIHKLFIDDVSLSMETCNDIPWDENNQDSICKGSTNVWCGWKYNNNTNNTWAMTSLVVLDSFRSEYNISKPTGPNGDIRKSEIILQPRDSLSVSTGFPRLGEFSLCLWLKTMQKGFRVEYTYKSEDVEKTGINFAISDTINIQILDTTLFRYVIFETEAKALTIYIRYANKSELFPIWTDEDSTTAEWKYGQVYFDGNVVGRRGYIALGSVYFENGDCDYEPRPEGRRVFTENVTTAPGYISSPFYPGYYIRDIEYWWYINAPVDHVIQLTFYDFILENHATCSADYVKVYSGDQRTGQSLGKFCGFMYPQFVESSTNHMTVIFHSNENAVRRGFKAGFQFIKGCPSNCKCLFIDDEEKNGKEERVLIEGQSLHAIPDNMPPMTFALDLTSNVIVLIDSNGFDNATSLRTLNLGNNKITKLSGETFEGLESLQHLNLSKNKLSDVSTDAFDYLQQLQYL
ncbi:hypothetical protein QZH41_004541 [Actinostola sp. cb2023]|nr:hypothetical protein QZH41_004541 [Actinostola sp. cb2023]